MVRGSGGEATVSATERERAAPQRIEGFEVMRVTAPPGLVRRALATNGHLVGLLLGALLATVRERRERAAPSNLRWLLLGLIAAIARPFLRRDLREEPFPVQFRRRLELLGPTYIKLGQILSLREDILPKSITIELRNLLNRLPVVPFDVFAQIVEKDLKRPLDEAYSWIDPVPLGSASIAQIHRATTLEGDEVVIKVVKPGIRETLRRDARLLRVLGAMLQWVIPRYQPRQIIGEFVDYTIREVDLRREADNADTFTANFRDLPDVLFPRVYRELSGPSVLTMEFFDGPRPDEPEALALPLEARERLVQLGAQSIIRMLYRDGFFHADLHPGNLIVLPGPRVGFIDLGMVGRLDGDLRRTLLFYYYSLVNGDAEGAARYLTMVARPGAGGDPAGFRREVSEISARWGRSASFDSFSLAQLILESVTRGAQFRMYFPVELVLMVKALITFEGVGNVLLPGIDVASVSRAHIRGIFLHQFSPFLMFKEGVRGAPDMIDALVKAPLLVTEGLQVLDRATRRSTENPFAGIRGTLIAGFCLVAAAIIMAFGGPWPLWGGLFTIAFFLALRKGG